MSLDAVTKYCSARAKASRLHLLGSRRVVVKSDEGAQLNVPLSLDAQYVAVGRCFARQIIGKGIWHLALAREELDPDAPSVIERGANALSLVPVPEEGFLVVSEQDPSLYELLLRNFSEELDLHRVREEGLVLLSVVNNLQLILNCPAGTISHLLNYGLPNMGQVLHEISGSAHSLMYTIERMVLFCEPRLAAIDVALSPQAMPGHLEYALNVKFRSGAGAMFCTTVASDRKTLIRHFKRMDYLLS